MKQEHKNVLAFVLIFIAIIANAGAMNYGVHEPIHLAAGIANLFIEGFLFWKILSGNDK